MSAIERLKAKIEEIRGSYQAAQAELATVKRELAEAGSSSEELDRFKSQLALKDEQIQQLRNEIIEKDTEIEAIIAKVETLLA